MADDLTIVASLLRDTNKKLDKLSADNEKSNSATSIIAQSLPEILSDRKIASRQEKFDQKEGVTEVDDAVVKNTKEIVSALTKLPTNIPTAPGWTKLGRFLADTNPSARLVEELKEDLESQFKVAEDNLEYQKLSYQSRKEIAERRLADATSPAAKKEIREEARADARKNGSRFEKIVAGITGLLEIGKKGLKTAALGGLAILSTLAIGAFMLALGKFLQSDTFKDMTKFIQEEILPYLTEIGIAIASIVGAVAIAKFIAAAKKVRLAFLAVQTFMLGTMVPETGKMTGGVAGKFASIANKIKLAFIAVQTFMLGTMLPSITAFMVPLLPVIAIAALVAAVLYGLWEAFKDFNKILEETGSIGEAIKGALTTFISTALGIIPALFLKLVAFVADMFGFEEFAKKIGDIDPIAWIAKSIEGLISDVVDFFKMLFDFDFAGFAKSLVPNWAKKILGVGGSDESPEAASANRVTKLEQERERLTERSKAKANTPRARQQARQAEILDKRIAREKASAAASLAKPMVLPKAKMSEAETLEAQRLSPSQYKQSGSIQEKMEKSKQQAELARQQGAVGGQTNIVDARQSSSVTTTGQTTGVIMPNKYGRLNMSDIGM